MSISRTKTILRSLAFFLVVAVSPWVVIDTAIPFSAQDFPLIDDWAFTHGAYAFFHNHELDYQNWGSLPLLGQWLWSLPFLAVLGDSHLTTRVSTIVLSWLGLWAFYALLRRQTGVSPSRAAFATACLAWNPYFFVLSGTFMTDVPALSFALIALALYAHALDSGRLLSLAAAFLAASAAVATRQNALAAPLTAGVMLLLSGYRTKPLWIAAVAVPTVLTFVLDAWLHSRPDVVPLHARVPNLDDVCWLAFTSAHYLGLLTIPLLLLLPPARLGKVFWAVLAIMAAAASWLVLMLPSYQHEGVFPYIGDLFLPSGTYVRMGNDRIPLFSRHVRLLPTALGCVCAAVLSARVAEQGWRLASRPLVIFSLLQLAALAIAPKYYDRYLLPLVPGAVALAVGEPGRPWWKAGLAALLVLGGLSVCLMHDWLSWNAARWELGRRAAVVHGIEPGDIRGGFEWDHYYPRSHSSHYRLALSPSRSCATIDVEPYTLWFPPRKRAMYLEQLPCEASDPMPQPEDERNRQDAKRR